MKHRVATHEYVLPINDQEYYAAATDNWLTRCEQHMKDRAQGLECKKIYVEKPLT